MKTDCMIIIISTISLTISIGVLLCLLCSGTTIKEGLRIEDFSGWAISILSLLVTILLGWNIATALDIKQEWKEKEKELANTKEELVELQLLRYESRANTQFSNACLFVFMKNYEGALHCALQAINNMLPNFKTNKKYDNFTKIEDVLRECIYDENGETRKLKYNEEDYTYLSEVYRSIKFQEEYEFLHESLKQLINSINIDRYKISGHEPQNR